MNEQRRHDITAALRMFARKGTYSVFLYIRNHDYVYYNDMMRHALEAHLINTRSSITTILNDLVHYELLDKTVLHTSPPRTQYSVNEKGRKIIKHLEEIEKIVVEK